MWLLTTDGFYSAVQSKTDPDVVVVRCRRKSDLQRLVDRIPDPSPPTPAGYFRPRLERDVGTDYPWRTWLQRREWEAVVSELASEVDYGNFKDAVQQRRGRRVHDVYLRVWAALIALEPRRRRRLARPRPPYCLEDFVGASALADRDERPF